MEVDNFIEEVVKNETNTLAIDFDGVIHDHNLGFHDGTCYGEPIKGAINAIKLLWARNFTIIIFTCKANPDRPLVDGKTGSRLIYEWLVKHNLDSYIYNIVYEKPNAKYYIDDKAITFTSWDKVKEEI